LIGASLRQNRAPSRERNRPLAAKLRGLVVKVALVST
jgi:hypothetical protein